MDLKERLTGRWWIPGEQGAAVHGTVEHTDDGIHLDAIQGIPLDVEPEWGTDVMLPLLHGETPNGTAVTLVSCRRTKWSSDTHGTERWRVNAVVVDRHLARDSDAVAHFRMQLGPLLEWADDPQTLTRTTSVTGSGLRIASTTESVGEASLAGADLDLRVVAEYEINESSATVSRTAVLHVTLSGNEFGIREAIEQYGFAIRDLLAWATRSYSSVDTIAFRLRSDDPVGPLATYHAQLTRPHAIPAVVPSFDMTFTRTSFGLDFDQLMRAWFQLWQRHRKTFTLMTVPTYAPYLYTDSKLLTAWLAIEGYHAVEMSLSEAEAAKAREDHRKRVDAMVAAAPPEHRDWAQERLRDGNQIGQKRKLEQVIERSGPTGAAILQANPNFARNAVAGRRKVAHPAPFAGDVGAQFLYLASLLRWLLTHCLLVDLGVPEATVGPLIGGDRHFQHDVSGCARYHDKP